MNEIDLKDEEAGYAARAEIKDAEISRLRLALERIQSRTIVNEVEGPELRAQNAANYRDAREALIPTQKESK